MIPALVMLLAVTATDWALLVGAEGMEGAICAKGREVCETARAAIQRGLWPIVPPETPTRCVPHPNCFSPASNCIERYNCNER